MVYRAKPHDTHWQDYFGWQLHINQGWRNASLIGVSGAEFLFEYEMPNGKYYLHSVGLDSHGYFKTIGKSVNKNRLPHKWVVVIAEAEWAL